VAWIVRVVKTGAEGDGRCVDVMEIDRPDNLRDIADLGLTLAEAKRLLAFNRRSSPLKPGTMPLGGRRAHAAVTFVG
jgi:hypothetical protein